jgi:hypothetical protein
MRGKSAGLVITFGGGAPMLTDGDIAAAVGLTRRRDDAGHPVPSCVRPEILQLHYGGATEYTYRIARATWNAVCGRVAKEDGPLARRGCVLAAEAIGGRKVTAEVVAHEAWVVSRRRESLEDQIGSALAWLNGEIYAASADFCEVLRTTYIEREADRLAAEGVRLRFIGDRSRLDPKLQKIR